MNLNQTDGKSNRLKFRLPLVESISTFKCITLGRLFRISVYSILVFLRSSHSTRTVRNTNLSQKLNIVPYNVRRAEELASHSLVSRLFRCLTRSVSREITKINITRNDASSNAKSRDREVDGTNFIRQTFHWSSFHRSRWGGSRRKRSMLRLENEDANNREKKKERERERDGRERLIETRREQREEKRWIERISGGKGTEGEETPRNINVEVAAR